jgi:predicted house-cleaning NTP pyrophosphatase (Maf/HAM1 superfamily)
MTAPAVYSPRRAPAARSCLRQLGVEFTSLRLRESTDRERDIIEGARDAEPALHYVERIARTKATVGWHRMLQRGLPPRPVLGADTEVVLDDRIFGKPKDAADAVRMLTLLSGRTHQVLTAVALCWEGNTVAGDLHVERDVPGDRARRDRALRRHRRAARQGRARTRSRAAPRRSCSASTAATPASWVCLCTRPPPRSPASGSPCYNHEPDVA